MPRSMILLFPAMLCVHEQRGRPMSTLTDNLRGKFVFFDGPDESGKSTQRQRLADALEADGKMETVNRRVSAELGRVAG